MYRILQCRGGKASERVSRISAWFRNEHSDRGASLSVRIHSRELRKKTMTSAESLSDDCPDRAAMLQSGRKIVVYYDPGLGTERAPGAQTWVRKTTTQALGLAFGYSLQVRLQLTDLLNPFDVRVSGESLYQDIQVAR